MGRCDAGNYKEYGFWHGSFFFVCFAGLAEFSRGWRSIGWSAGFDTTVSSLYILNDYEHGVGWMNGSIGRDGMGIGMPFFGFEGTYISL